MPDFSGQIQILDTWINNNKDKQGSDEFNAVVGDLRKLISANAPVQEDKGFIQKTQESFGQHGEVASKIFEAKIQGERGWGETALNLVGKVGIPIVSDVIINGVVEGVQALTPDPVGERVTNAATYAMTTMLDTEAGKLGLEALYKGMDTYGEWKKENPRMAMNLESVVNIGLAFTPLKSSGAGATGVGKSGLKDLPKRIASRTDDLVSTMKTKAAGVSDRGPLTTAAKGLDRRALNQATKEKYAWIERSATPRDTKSINAKLIERGKLSDGGKLQSRKYIFGPDETSAINDMTVFSGIKAGDTPLRVYNESKTTLSRLEDQMRRYFTGGKKQQYSFDDFVNEMDALKAKVSVENGMLIGGDQLKNVNTLFDDMIQAASKKPKTAKGLMMARREYDRLIENSKTKNMLYGDGPSNAIKNTHLSIRTRVNELIADKVPESKGLLKRQSNIYRLQKTFLDNAAIETNSVIANTMGKLTRFFGTRSDFTNIIAGLVGVGGLGAASLGAPFWTFGFALPIAAYKGGKMILSPTAKKGLSELIKGTDMAIKLTRSGATEFGKYGTKQTIDLLQSFKADRAVLIQLLEEGQE